MSANELQDQLLSLSSAGGINPRDLEALLSDQGVTMLHAIGVRCTCQRSDPLASMVRNDRMNTSRPWCPRCAKDGWLYRDRRPMQGIQSMMDLRTVVLEGGISQPGDMRFGPSAAAGTDAGYRPVGTHDKLWATWPEEVDGGEVLIRGVANRPEVRGRIPNATGVLAENEDVLRYEPHSVIWCEDEDGKLYDEGDFFFPGGRVLAWADARGPADGKAYSLKYLGYHEWIAYMPPQERRIKGANMGQLVYLRKRHLVLLNDAVLPTDGERFSVRNDMVGP